MTICRNPNCEMENRDSEEFCKFCGRRLRDPRKNNNKKVLRVMSVIALIIVVGISAKAIFGSKAVNKNDVGNTNKNNIVQTVNGDNVSGYKFVFIKGNAKINDIYLNNIDGTTKKITNSNAENKYPNISAHGSKIVFERKEGKIYNIYVINIDGTSEKKLTEGHAPTWSADGSKILFYNRDPKSISNILYSIKPDGTEITQESKTSDSYGMASYLNDGSRVAFAKKTIEGFGIYIVKPDFTGARQLTTSSNMEDQPVWSQDGTKIAFSSQRDGISEIYTVDLNKNVTRVTNNQVPDINPSFTQDGKLVFTREELGTSNIYIADADGKNEKLLLKDAAYASIAVK